MATMNPSPITPYTITLLLQYISPPSQLDRPIPPNLISKSLLQRHHFLSINPDSIEDYLCWPSSHSMDVIRILESISSTTTDLDAEHSIRYSSDTEQTQAHVRVTSNDTPLRLVFEWDYESGDWRYHDATVMPFPLSSHDSLYDAISSHSTLSGASSRRAPTFADEDEKGSDDESYWNAYGQDDDYHPEQGLSGAEKDSMDDSEDAYWAQYSAVQGTADSTVPSPVVPDKRKTTDGPFPGYGDESIVYSYTEMHPNTERSLSGRLSPTRLTNRLSSLVARDGHGSPSSLFESTDSESLTCSPSIVVLSDEESARSPATGQRSALSQQTIEDADVCVLNQRACDHLDLTDENGPLRESIRGIYNLWKAGRRGRMTPQLGNVAEEREQFLRIVQVALA